MKNWDVIKKFVNGEKEGRTKHLFIEGNVLYSYGHHFPIAIRTNMFIVNMDKYSVTTSRHQSYLRGMLEGYVSSNTKEMQEMIRNESN